MTIKHPPLQPVNQYPVLSTVWVGMDVTPALEGQGMEAGSLSIAGISAILFGEPVDDDHLLRMRASHVTVVGSVRSEGLATVSALLGVWVDGWMDGLMNGRVEEMETDGLID